MIIPFLTNRWKKLTTDQLLFLTARADIKFKAGYHLGWGRRFSIIQLEGNSYAINSAYGYHHLDNLLLWLSQQGVSAPDYSHYLNQGMKELNLW